MVSRFIFVTLLTQHSHFSNEAFKLITKSSGNSLLVGYFNRCPPLFWHSSAVILTFLITQLLCILTFVKPVPNSNISDIMSTSKSKRHKRRITLWMIPSVCILTFATRPPNYQHFWYHEFKDDTKTWNKICFGWVHWCASSLLSTVQWNINIFDIMSSRNSNRQKKYALFE